MKRCREKGKFFWKKRWISICSRHYEYDKKCSMCNAGYWNNVWMIVVDSFFHDNFYKLWYWYVNKY